MKKIKIANICRIPTANTPYYISQLVNEFSRKFESRHILGSHYSKKFQETSPYREFPYDLFWETQKDSCVKVIREADIVHIHHGFWHDDKEIINLLKEKKVIFSVCDLSLGNNAGYFKNILKQNWIITVYDQPAQRAVFSKYSDVFLPLVNCYWETIIKNNEVPHVVFAPTNRQPITTASSKGYYEVLEIINRLKSSLNFTFDLIEGVPHTVAIERTKKADIIIDDIVHETFHNTSIFAALFNAVAITGYSGKDYPFIKANLNSLENTLSDLITNPVFLLNEKNKLQEWRKFNYTPFKLIKFYDDFYTSVFNDKYKPKTYNIETIEAVEEPKVVIQEKLTSLGYATPYEHFKEFLGLVNKYTRVCLLENTCLKIIKGGLPVSQTEFFAGIEQIEAVRNILLGKGFNIIENTIVKGNMIIHLLNFQQNNKPWTVGKENVVIPFPVTKYLRKLYGKNWDK